MASWRIMKLWKGIRKGGISRTVHAIVLLTVACLVPLRMIMIAFVTNVRAIVAKELFTSDE